MSLASDVHFFRSFSHAELEQSMADLALPDELNASLLAYLTQRKDMISLAARAYDESYKDNSGAFDIMRRKPFTRLAIICALLPGLRQRFIDAGIPRQVWLDSIDDIRLRARLYFEKTGKVGLSKNDARWLRHLMGFKLFKIGSLQFQPFEMLYLDKEGIGRDIMRFTETQKLRLPPGMPVLNTHIQHGADLRPEALRATFAQARDFFRRYFPSQDFKAFISYTWLLYPGLNEVLPAESRILQFAEMWDIVSVVDDKTQALERIFGGRRRRKADYPQESSLQRLALRHMDALGYALGMKEF
jgi:hypothetical protein